MTKMASDFVFFSWMTIFGGAFRHKTDRRLWFAHVSALPLHDNIKKTSGWRDVSSIFSRIVKHSHAGL
jgi:hypothetical protein